MENQPTPVTHRNDIKRVVVYCGANVGNNPAYKIAAENVGRTLAEQGFPEINIVHWAGVHAPSGVPTDILDKLAAAVDAAMKMPEAANRLKASGIEPIGGTRASFVQFVAEERARLAAIIKISGMRED